MSDILNLNWSFARQKGRSQSLSGVIERTEQRRNSREHRVGRLEGLARRAGCAACRNCNGPKGHRRPGGTVAESQRSAPLDLCQLTLKGLHRSGALETGLDVGLYGPQQTLAATRPMSAADPKPTSARRLLKLAADSLTSTATAVSRSIDGKSKLSRSPR